MKTNIKKTRVLARMGLVLAILTTIACQKPVDSFSVLSASSTFKASSSFTQKKIDVLWVIDNSGSMQPHQNNLVANFTSFIQNFSAKNYDFHMGVTTTDAYFAYHYNDPTRSKLRDGLGANHTGVFVIDRNTPNLSQVFMTNVLQGTAGNGDERAFSSFEHALGNSLNVGFRRPGAYLAIIILSDEDDMSHYDWQNGVSSYVFTANYNYPTMFTTQHFVDFLDNLTQSTATVRNYSVHNISPISQSCATSLGRSQMIRYPALSAATGGTSSDLCGNFDTALNALSQQVIAQASIFQLDRVPIVNSIQVSVNGAEIPQSAVNGWTYDANTNSIELHGTAQPQEGDDIKVNFDPASADF